MAGITYDHEKIHLNLARIKKDGEKFEIAVDPDLAISMKKGGEVDIHEVLKSEKIFSDTKKGLLASEHKLKEIFGTDNVIEVAKEILKHGEIQLTGEYRKSLIDEKRKKIINIIQKNAVDPKTGIPHPLTRIENAFEEANVRIDEFKSSEEQVGEIIKQIKLIIPLSMETKTIEFTIPAEHAAKAYSVLQRIGRFKQENWNSDGSLTAVIEVAAGMQQQLFDEINKVVHGNLESNILK